MTHLIKISDLILNLDHIVAITDDGDSVMIALSRTVLGQESYWFDGDEAQGLRAYLAHHADDVVANYGRNPVAARGTTDDPHGSRHG